MMSSQTSQASVPVMTVNRAETRTCMLVVVGKGRGRRAQGQWTTFELKALLLSAR